MMNKRWKYDWTKIQSDYDSGLSQRELVKKYGMSMTTLVKAARTTKFNTRTASQASSLGKKKFPRKQSLETRKKISKARILYLTNNPDKVPYKINHSSKASFPEICFEKALIESDIKGWIKSYQIGIYEYDFAFPQFKVDVEIDGSTHLQEKVKLIDQRRDEWSEKNGWKVIRFSAKKVKQDINSCINELRSLLKQMEL